jgi:hypothetical protein
MAAMGVVPAFDELEDLLSAYRKIIAASSKVIAGASSTPLAIVS